MLCKDNSSDLHRLLSIEEVPSLRLLVVISLFEWAKLEARQTLHLLAPLGRLPEADQGHQHRALWQHQPLSARLKTITTARKEAQAQTTVHSMLKKERKKSSITSSKWPIEASLKLTPESSN